MKSGWIRLGILVTVIWLVCVAALSGYEFSSRNVFCQFAAPGTLDPLCQHYFWHWISSPENGGSLALNIERMLSFAVG
ncbi:MAG TPA: hypothetical protein VGJ72_14245, partial [Polaromonas sp.]